MAIRNFQAYHDKLCPPQSGRDRTYRLGHHLPTGAEKASCQDGKSKILWFFLTKSSELESAIAQTVLACEQMSKTKTGALILFERNIMLNDLMATGTIIDADTTAELLKNIFYPKAPLHDGAVIIKKGRIASAGCVLPLTSNNNLSKDLGMRHRAGIGASEQSDAVVVIVSEETGAISVAIEGMLKRNLDKQTFEKLLHNELVREEVGKNTASELISRIFGRHKVNGDEAEEKNK